MQSVNKSASSSTVVPPMPIDESTVSSSLTSSESRVQNLVRPIIQAELSIQAEFFKKSVCEKNIPLGIREKLQELTLLTSPLCDAILEKDEEGLELPVVDASCFDETVPAVLVKDVQEYVFKKHTEILKDRRERLAKLDQDFSKIQEKTRLPKGYRLNVLEKRALLSICSTGEVFSFSEDDLSNLCSIENSLCSELRESVYGFIRTFGSAGILLIEEELRRGQFSERAPFVGGERDDKKEACYQKADELFRMIKITHEKMDQDLISRTSLEWKTFLEDQGFREKERLEITSLFCMIDPKMIEEIILLRSKNPEEASSLFDFLKGWALFRRQVKIHPVNLSSCRLHYLFRCQEIVRLYSGFQLYHMFQDKKLSVSDTMALRSLFGELPRRYTSFSVEFFQKALSIQSSIPEIKNVFYSLRDFEIFLTRSSKAEIQELCSLRGVISDGLLSLNGAIELIISSDKHHKIFGKLYTFLFPTTLYSFASTQQPRDQTLFWYCSEAVGRLESDIKDAPLSSIPTELLVRYLSSKLFVDIESMSKELFNGKPRFATLSDQQKYAILKRFRQTNRDKPLPAWTNLLGMTELEAEQFCLRIEESHPIPSFPLSSRSTQLHEELAVNIDEHDPVSLISYAFNRVSTEDLSAPLQHRWCRAIEFLLTEAQEESVCGGRAILKWGNVSLSSACVAGDSMSLQARHLGSPFMIYPRGVFNDPWFGVGALSLHRRLRTLAEKEPDSYSRLQRAVCPNDLRSQEEKELFFEIQRIAVHHMQKGTGSFQEEFRKKYRCHISVFPEYDSKNYHHRYFFEFLALLRMGQLSLAMHDNRSFDFGFRFSQEDSGRPLEYIVSSLPEKETKFLMEDNPEIENFSAVKTDYIYHDISAVTPMTPRDIPLSISPEEFLKFISMANALTHEQFFEIENKALVHLRESHPEFEDQYDFGPYLEAFGRICDAVLPGFMEANRHVIGNLAAHYVQAVDRVPPKLFANKTYLFDRQGVQDFCPKEQVPEYLRGEGNFASIICCSYEPYRPTRHDGNCGINSFLLGLYGVDAYGPGGRDLTADIQTFRDQVLVYAIDHPVELREICGGEESAEEFKRQYADEEWNTREVWAIAARLYNRTIRIFTCVGHNAFKTGPDKKVVPFDQETEVFTPLLVSSEAPIDLMLWGPHYCYLKPRV